MALRIPVAAPLTLSAVAERNLRNLSRVSSYFPEIEAATKLFEEAESLFNNLLVPEDDPDVRLLDVMNRELVRRVGSRQQVVVPFVGPNSAGKSTLMNTMTGARLMPVGEGHVTGRVCMMVYEEPQNSFVSEISLEDFERGTLRNDASQSTTGFTDKQVSDLLSSKLKRENAPDPSNLAEWSQKIVVLGHPIPLLSHGLTLVDLPGTSSTDEEAIQNFLRNFLKIMRPPGMFMLYSNDSFSDAEMACYNFFTDALPKGDADQDPEIFFIKTQFDLAKISYDNTSSQTTMNRTIWMAEIKKSFGLLKERSAELPQARLAVTYEEETNFACVSAMDASRHRTSPNENAKAVWDEFLERLSFWLLRLQQTRYSIAFATMAEACRNFYHTMHSLKCGRMEKIQEEMASGVAALDDFSKKLQLRTYGIAAMLPSRLSSRASNSQIISSLCNMAAATPLRGYDGQPRTGSEKQALGALKAAMTPAVNQHLINPALAELRDELEVHVRADVKELLQAIEENGLLENALANVIKVTDITSGMYLHTGAYGSLINGFVSALMGKGALTGVLFAVSSPLLLLMFMGAGVLTAIKAVVGLAQKIDDDWKRTAMKHIISEVPKLSTPDTMAQGASDAILALTQRVKDEMKARMSAAHAAALKFKMAEQFLPDLRIKFAKLETLCWAARLKMSGFGEAPIYDMENGKPKVLSEGATGLVYTGTWCQHAVVMKKPKIDSPVVMLSFFEEIHYNRELTKGNSTNILRALGVYQDPQDGSWALMYPKCHGNLRNYLLDQHKTGKAMTVKAGLDILLQTAKGIHSMHELGVMHRDIKFDNTLYIIKPDGSIEVFITDFGTCTNNKSPTTIIGTPYFIAPEIERSQGEAYSFKADIYSLGVMIHMVFTDIDARAKAELDSGAPGLWTLLFLTIADEVDKRPEISVVLQALEQLWAKFK
jgi:serine/threonine protein kinase